MCYVSILHDDYSFVLQPKQFIRASEDHKLLYRLRIASGESCH